MQVSDDFKPLICPCPSIGCDNRESINWHCKGCNSGFLINSDAIIKCEGCSTRKPIPIIDSDFVCDSNSHDGESRRVDAMGVLLAIGIMRSNLKSDERLWGDRLTKSVKKLLLSRDDF